VGLLASLLGRPQAPEAPAGWQVDGLGVSNGGDCAGDVQDGNAYSVRYWNPALPGRFIAVTYIPVQYPGWSAREWGVERHVEWSIRDRPGDDPWWEDCETGLVNPTAYYNQADAEADAYTWAAEDAALLPDEVADMYGTWDGEPYDPAQEG
jgi:hypothetical protein